MKSARYLPIVVAMLLLASCAEDPQSSTLFEQKDLAAIGIDFSNDLTYSRDFNVYKYRNFYNGGGVAIGDVNNDGLPDIYFTANQLSNRLFINKGDWQFEDVTEIAGVAGSRAWSTGATMVDVNADGMLDIYVCNSGDVEGDNKENELFINQGDLTFVEAAAEYGLNDKGYSTHASFFDYDKDGDLDVYLLNNSFQAIGSFNLRKNERPVRDELGGDKLLQNNNGQFTDVSEQARIYGSVIGFGLGVTVGDVNNDGWEDIFVSNDFFERDYLYINQQDGTFSEDLVASMPSISGASMGADIGDIDNDGYNDIFVTEMLPSDYERLKSVTTFESWDRYQYSVTNGYHHQFTRNTLHRNNGDNTFSEVSRHAGVEASDWSWGALFFDMDNDGYKDLFVANGIYKDLTDQDYLQYIANESVLKSLIQDDGVNYKELIDIIPSHMVPNHVFKNKGGLQFESFTSSGLAVPSFSNGSAYGDLDNDGDLDLVVNNVNMPCFVYENKASATAGHRYIKLDLVGEGANPLAVGARVTVISGEQRWIAENQPARGFQSSMDRRIHIGLGDAVKINVEVLWPDGTVTNINDVNTNQTLKVKQSAGQAQVAPSRKSATPKLERVGYGLQYQHRENKYVDFNRERLLYHMMSTRGPCVSVGDMNADGVPDLVVPSPKDSPSQVLLGNSAGGWSKMPIVEDLAKLKAAEHVECELFDADNDGDLDVYMASGGVELTKYSGLLYDKVLLNDGTGRLQATDQELPSKEARISSSVVAHADVDADGDQDLFVGERVKIGRYGAPCSGYLLLNDGNGNYTDHTTTVALDLQDLGMITDADFIDLDADDTPELVVVGEFMPVTIFKMIDGKYEVATKLPASDGWWQAMHSTDLDGDGDQDLVLANHGTNSRFAASEEHPVKMYYSDFDGNGTPEGVVTHSRADGKDYPYALRHTLAAQMPYIKKKFPNYQSFKDASIEDIFNAQQLAKTTITKASEMRSMVLINNGELSFKPKYLPASVQMSPMYAITSTDIDDDGDQDLLMGGNLYDVQPEMGRYDASYGHILLNDGTGTFKDVATEWGFSVNGEIRDILVLGGYIYVFRNGDAVVTFKIN